MCHKILYNCNNWAAPKKFLDKLDACHRRHLRTITSHHWPDSVISNNALYKMCNVVPLSVRVNQQRWSMFGHVLRMPENTPAQQALEFAVLGSSKYRSCRGRHCSNLLSLLQADLREAGFGTLRLKKKLREFGMLAKETVAHGEEGLIAAVGWFTTLQSQIQSLIINYYGWDPSWLYLFPLMC